MNASKLFRLDGRVAVVTGAARGIGQCIAETLSQLGAIVVLADRLPLVRETAATIARDGARTEGVVLDVADRAAVDAAIDGVAARYGRIDALVANAGWSYEADSVDHSDENWTQSLNINLNGVFYAIRRAGKHMVAQKSGAIVGISSIAGVKYVRPEHHVGYDVAKAGVAHMCRVLGCEWASSGVRVNAVGPGYTDTEMLAEVGRTRPEVMRRWIEDIPMGRLLKREEIASAIAFLLSDAASGITGQLVMVDAGYSAA
jgi:NAD(P)-dependent dehydrogenase (short-subunit alcohol dehydrogenase family)